MGVCTWWRGVHGEECIYGGVCTVEGCTYGGGCMVEGCASGRVCMVEGSEWWKDVHGKGMCIVDGSNYHFFKNLWTLCHLFLLVREYSEVNLLFSLCS